MMTPEQKIKHLILIAAEDVVASYGEGLDHDPLPKVMTGEEIDAQWKARNEDGELQDDINEFREGQFETGLKCEWSRHYESKAVSAQYIDGSWVGWTYWYGGGKHGEPEGIDWIDEAYDLICTEEVKLTTVRTFALTDVPA